MDMYARRTVWWAVIIRLVVIAIPTILFLIFTAIEVAAKWMATRLDDAIGYLADLTPSPEVLVPIEQPKTPENENDDIWKHGV